MRQTLNDIKTECEAIVADLDLQRAEVWAKPYESPYMLACMWANRDALCHALHRLHILKDSSLTRRAKLIKSEYKRYEGFGPGMYKWLEWLD